MPAPEEPSDADVMESDVEDLSGDSQDATAECSDDDESSIGSDDDEGEWQDERCLQPIQKTPGVSPLCNACKHNFSECPSFGVVRTRESSGVLNPHGNSGWLKFLRSLQVLELSAQNGCAFCKLVFARIRRDRAEFRPAKAVRIKFHVLLIDKPSRLNLSLTLKGHTWPGSTAIRSNYNFFTIMDETESFQDGVSKHDLLPHTDCKNNLELMATWVGRCTAEHPKCTPKTSKGYFCPTRLLDLRAANDTSVVALIESSELRRLTSHGQYVALSHCWGGLLPLKLTNNNIDTLKGAINLSQLPKTFQDAIALTRFMQIRYLWIDSLCIIQDSHTDWEFEASTMKDVYKHADFTIAATGARNSGDGLYFDRDVDLVGAVTLPVCWQGLPRGIYTICDHQLWFDNITDAPLNRRAWVVQERLLSCRTLNLGRDQIAWKCQTLQACETFPAKLPLRCTDYEEFAFKTELADDAQKMVREVWNRIVRTYSRGRLTEETDKCIAISGIVEEIQSATGDHYFAGLWESSFVLQMCWTIDHVQNERYRQTPKRPRRYRAPSWSWLSIDSIVEFYSGNDNVYDILFEVLNVRIDNTGLNNFGSIKGGYIVGRGLLKPALWGQSTDDQVGHLLIDDESIEHGGRWHDRGSTQVTMDLGLGENCNSVWCLPVLRVFVELYSGTPERIIGIILVPTGHAEEEYKRVGCFHLGDELGESIFKEYTDSPHRSFTIV